MRIKVELCLPVSVELELELVRDNGLPEEDWEFDIKGVQLAMVQGVSVPRVNEAITDADHEYILTKAIEAWKAQQ